MSRVSISDVPRLSDGPQRAPFFVIDDFSGSRLHIADNMRPLEFDTERLNQITQMCGYAGLVLSGYGGEMSKERFSAFELDDSLMPKWVQKLRDVPTLTETRLIMLLHAIDEPSPMLMPGLGMNVRVNYNAVPSAITRITRQTGVTPKEAYELLFQDIINETVGHMRKQASDIVGGGMTIEYEDDRMQVADCNIRVATGKRRSIGRFLLGRDIKRIMAGSPDGQLVALRPHSQTM